MKVSLSNHILLLGMFTLLFISACSDDGSSSSSAKTNLKNTNVYFFKNEIQSFNPNTRTSAPKAFANYVNGEQTLLTLNTDNDNEGYEHIIYMEENIIYSRDAESLKELKLASVFDDAEVCIFPNPIPDQSSFEGSTKGERILVDHTSIFITPKTNTGCDKEAATIKKIDFTDTNNITISEISAAHLWGDTLLDYAGTTSNTNDDGEVTSTPGRYGFLGSNYNAQKSSLELSFYNHENNMLWETSFPITNSLPTINQVTPTEVLIQIDGTLYLLDIEKLFDVAVIDSNEDLPIGSKVEALFESPIAKHLLSKTDIGTLQVASNGSTFALVDDGEVLLYDASLKKFEPLDVFEGTVLKVQIKMTDDGSTILLHRTFTAAESLLRINTTTKANETIATTGQDSTISFQTLDNNIYINSFTQTDWQADWINAQSSRVSFDKSMFVFSKNSRTANSETELFLIASDEEVTADGNLTQAKLFAFSPSNTTNGRKQYRKDKNSPITDFIFGEFTVDIKAVSNSEFTNDIFGKLETSNSEITNDVYGKLELNSIRDISDIATDATEIYFFNPSETVSNETEDPNNKTLQLIDFEEDII